MFFFFLVAVTIGFSATSYSVNECDGQVNIIIAVLKGSLKRKVAVHLSTSDVTANGELKTFVEQIYKSMIILLLFFS